MWTLPAHVPTNTYFAGTTPPLPALVTVGGGDDRRVLLDLERLGVVTIGGDHAGAADLLRHVGAELTHGIWSDDVTIGIAGFDDDDTRRLTALGRGRVRASDSIADALDDAGRWINEAHERLAGLGVNNVLSGRVNATPAEARRLSPYALLLAGPGAGRSGTARARRRVPRGPRPGPARDRGDATSGDPAAQCRLNRGRWPLTVGRRSHRDDGVPGHPDPGGLARRCRTRLAGRRVGRRGSGRHPMTPDIPIGRHRATSRPDRPRSADRVHITVACRSALTNVAER